ncbi:hypothetical protein EsDP_00001346 [Epichloe bromicola]|uniref:Mcm2 3 5 family protein n=1 Tax=Epichloe bromicola TaxID=79588 RepID=A0ABQ0CHK4_9HYPO
MADWVPAMAPSEEVDDERLISPLSSNSSPTSPESRTGPLRNTHNAGGYDLVDSDHVDIAASSKDEFSPQPRTMSPGSTDGLGISPCHKASNSSLPRKPVAAETIRGKPPRGRFIWATSSRLSHLLDKLGPRKRTGRGADPSNDNLAPRCASNSSGLPSPEAAGCRASKSLDIDIEPASEDFDDEVFNQKFGEPPSYCWSKKDVQQKKSEYIPRVIFALSIYSTVMSGMWLVVSILQPRYGHGISSQGKLQPSTATLLTALFAKTIELSFVTVFISFLGQVLSRRSFVKRAYGGMTLAEITMRNWILQPGSLITHFETVPYAGWSILGALTLTATSAAMFYTTASDAMVSPKLMTKGWEWRELSGPIAASYANVNYLKDTCPDMFGSTPRIADNDVACMQIQFSGQSHRNLFSFMSTWADIKANGTAAAKELRDRPSGKHSLYENTTMVGAWIETRHGNVTASFEKYGRIINNVTMAMPHPGVHAAATSPENEIMQPIDLGGVGEYTIRAGVVSPAINVMCVNMDRDELAPLVYTEWPFSTTTSTGVGTQRIGPKDWQDFVPHSLNQDGNPEYLNRSAVDGIFRWGPEFRRRPPVFSMYPSDYNMVANSSVLDSDSIYILTKSHKMDNYTLCEMRSWVTPLCSTEFRSSGTAGTSMKAWCEDSQDTNAYHRSFPQGFGDWPAPAKDWKSVAEVWRLALDINGGYRNNNATNARQLTQLILDKPRFAPDLPSLAEALAAFCGSTLVASSIRSPFRHYWEYQSTQLTRDKADYFNASLTTQQYTSGHVLGWQKLFYLVLSLVFVINVFCFLYALPKPGLVTDFTEPQNLFALAINSPPSAQLKGSCGGGPEKRDLVVPWRVAYAPSANHYFLEEANENPWRGRYAREAATTARPEGNDAKGISYKRLSSGRGWL